MPVQLVVPVGVWVCVAPLLLPEGVCVGVCAGDVGREVGVGVEEMVYVTNVTFRILWPYVSAI